jgi:hypothetical protein
MLGGWEDEDKLIRHDWHRETGAGNRIASGIARYPAST